MDPISKEIENFREALRDFRQNPKARILHVITQPSQVHDITKTLRAEEWQLENRSLFLIFDTAFIKEEETFNEMCLRLREHYDLLREGLAQQKINLSELDIQLKGKEKPNFIFILHVYAFLRNIREHFDGLLVCWLPTMIKDKRKWQKTVTELLQLFFEPAIRFVIADEENKVLEKEFRDTGEVATTTFNVDEKAVLDYFKKLMNSDKGGPPPSVAGAPSGAARPDVPPPLRKVGPRQPSEEEIQAAIKASGTPMLTPSDGDKLRKLIMDAAMASGEKRIDDAISLQKMACDLCHEAGVRLEECLMIMVLASYFQQARQIKESVGQYIKAASIAQEIEAYPQLSQSHMSLGYLYLAQKFYDLAAVEYEKAAEAAQKYEDSIIFIEMMRMAGTCYLKLKDRDSAEQCWRKAVELARTAMPDQIKLSSFKDVASALIDLLYSKKLKEQAQSVEFLVMEIGERSQSKEEVQK